MAEAEDLKTVVLNDKHVALGGRMVLLLRLFAAGGIPPASSPSNGRTREHAGLFDVSHMGPSFLVLDDKSGDGEADHAAVAAIVEPLVCGDIAGLKPGQIRQARCCSTTRAFCTIDLMIVRPAGRGGWGRGRFTSSLVAGTKEEDFQRIAAAFAGEGSR